MNTNAIEIRNLQKTYAASKKSPAKTALKGVDLDIPKGSIFGLLGPNGAGKSTIINIMAGLVNKTGGTVKIWGHDIDIDQRNAKASIGVVPQEINQDAFFTPLKTLDIQAGMYGVPKHERRSMEILKLLSLEDKAKSYARSLSGGMKRRLMVGKAMVHNPPILVLDEPTAGVDVELRRQLWANVRAMNDQGITIVLTTHYLEEAEELCDKIAIINHGEIIVCEDTPKLLARIDQKTLRFTVNQDINNLPEAFGDFNIRQEGPRTLAVSYKPKEQEVGKILNAISTSGYTILDLSSEESNLEDVFLQLTGHA